MKFFEDIVAERKKYGHVVCGDVHACDKGSEGTALILCDGIGSGVYANIAASMCAGRLRELLRSGVPLRSAAEMVAASMHKAREAEIPFSAFSAAFVAPDGRFSAYTYESPEPIAILNGSAHVLKPVFYTAGYEVVGESGGTLEIGDSLLLSSDGVTQAGLGHGYAIGIGSQAVEQFINRQLSGERHAEAGRDIRDLPEQILELCASVSGGRFEDDTTCALLHCREASQLTILSGPPSKPAKDAVYVADFMARPGARVVCGSTTAEIVARELKSEVTMLAVGAAFGSPPEYKIKGVDLTTEGAFMLSQVHNILGEPSENFEGGVVERLCLLLEQADAVHFMLGGGINAAHSALLFKQLGVMPRKKTIQLLTDKLKKMGKVVTEASY